MSSFFNVTFLIALSLNVGAIIFFSFFTTPTLFREAPVALARELVAKMFPSYYILGYATQFIALASLGLRGVFEKPFPWVRVLLLVLMLGCTLYAGLNLLPKAHTAKTVLKTLEPGPEQDAKQAEFDRLHRFSVALNGTVLVTGLMVLGITAVKLRPLHSISFLTPRFVIISP